MANKKVTGFKRTTKSAYAQITNPDADKVFFLQNGDGNESDKGYLVVAGKKYGNGIKSATYNSTNNRITFQNIDGTDNASYIDCSSFLVDGMVEDVKLITIKNYTASDSYVVGDFINSGHQIYECIKACPAGTTFSSEYFTLKSSQDIAAGNYLYVDFNTASGKQDIFIPLTDIFNPENYVAKASSIGADYLMQMDANGNAVNSGKKTTDFAAASHTHGNIQDTGALQTNDVAVANGDKLVITDASDSNKVARASVEFDGSTTTKALTPKGTFETFLQSHQDISGKADKVSGATNGNFAGLDANGNLTDSGKKAADFATATQGSNADAAKAKTDKLSFTQQGPTAYIIDQQSDPLFGVVDDSAKVAANVKQVTISKLPEYLYDGLKITVQFPYGFTKQTNQSLKVINGNGTAVGGTNGLRIYYGLNSLYAPLKTKGVYEFVYSASTGSGDEDKWVLVGELDTAPDISGKADKVSGATNGNLAGLDANGNLTDSGKKASDFATAAQGTKADSAIQSVKVNGTALTPDANKSVSIPTADSHTFGVSKLFGFEVAGSDSGVGSYSAAYVNSAIANATLMWEGE